MSSHFQNAPPFVMPRVWVLGLSSVLWLIPAFFLLRFATIWSEQLKGNGFILAGGIAAVTIVIVYAAWFRKVTLNNIQRIRALPDPSGIGGVLSGRGIAMIILMVATGITLRSSAIPRLYLAVPYALMGGCLLIGSLQTAHAFMYDLRFSRKDA